MKKFTFNLRKCGFILTGLVLMSFSVPILLEEQAVYIQNMLKDHYDERSVAPEIKRYELNVTNTGFCRYKCYFTSGKVAYFSFNLKKFKDIDYYGSDKRGTLYLRTIGEDVIMQTYNDRRNGDIDSMASCMSIPLKNIEPQDLIDLSDRLAKMNAQLSAQK